MNMNINTTVDLPVAGNEVTVTIIQLIYFSIGILEVYANH